jgi:hypothetical protein
MMDDQFFPPGMIATPLLQDATRVSCPMVSPSLMSPLPFGPTFNPDVGSDPPMTFSLTPTPLQVPLCMLTPTLTATATATATPGARSSVTAAVASVYNGGGFSKAIRPSFLVGSSAKNVGDVVATGFAAPLPTFPRRPVFPTLIKTEEHYDKKKSDKKFSGTKRSSASSSLSSSSSSTIVNDKEEKRRPLTRNAAVALENREEKMAKKRRTKRQKEMGKAARKKEKKLEKLRQHYLKLGLKPIELESIIAAAPNDARYLRKVPTLDMCILPIGDTIPLTTPLPVPFDCISFDGKYMLSVLAMTDRRDTPTICRFIHAPPEEAKMLLGPVGMINQQESYLSPSFGAAWKRCHLKSTNGWTQYFVIVIHENKSYRVPVDRFRLKKGGPGFVVRKGMEMTEEEINHMCELATKIHPSTSEYLQKDFFNTLHSMGTHNERSVLPLFLQSFLKCLPTINNENPASTLSAVPYAQYALPPISPTFLPTFCHVNS